MVRTTPINSKTLYLTCLQSYNNPTQIFADDVTEEKGENARLSAFVGAIAVGDLVKTTLGPKGMDKILQSAYVPDLYKERSIKIRGDTCLHRSAAQIHRHNHGDK